jgi:hypothetical protein
LVSAHVPRCLICAQVLIFVQQVQRRTCLGVSRELIFPSSFLSTRASTPAWFFLACFSSGLHHARSACSAIDFLPLARAQAAAVIQFTRAARLGAGPVFCRSVLLLLASYRSPEERTRIPVPACTHRSSVSATRTQAVQARVQLEFIKFDFFQVLCELL